jgi:hypothetical protein
MRIGLGGVQDVLGGPHATRVIAHHAAFPAGALQVEEVVDEDRFALSRIPRLAAISKYCVLLFDAACDG